MASNAAAAAAAAEAASAAATGRKVTVAGRRHIAAVASRTSLDSIITRHHKSGAHADDVLSTTDPSAAPAAEGKHRHLVGVPESSVQLEP